MINKVLLFTPPATLAKSSYDLSPLPPLGLAYLAAVLEKKDIEVKIVDSLMEGWENIVYIGDDFKQIGLSFDEIEKRIKDFKPDMVGVSNLFTKQRENAHKIHEIVKKVNPDIVTVAGGPHPTVMPEKVMEDKNVDYIVMGEGEESLAKIVDFLNGKTEITLLDGVGYRLNGEVTIRPKTHFLENLDSIPFPARHLLKTEEYFKLKGSHGARKHRRWSPIITSRGCPAKCTFCSAHMVWGRKFRTRSPENVIAEMKQIKEKYDIREIMFEDDNVTFDVKRSEKIFDLMIEEKLNFDWDTPNGVAVWTLTKELIKKMKDSGCYKLNFAVESGNKHVLNKIIKKPLRLDSVKPLVEYARKLGLETGVFLVIGLPGETEEQIWDSIRFAKDLGVFHPNISIATPYPGTELYDKCVEDGLLVDDFSLDHLFIRSYPIVTKDWDSEKLKRIHGEAVRYLTIASFLNNPVAFMKRAWRRFTIMPLDTLRRPLRVLITGRWREMWG